MIRILHVVTYMGRGGLETMLMNYYRHIDRTKIQFDFLVHRDFNADYDNEIETLGGIIHRLPRLVPWSIKYRKSLNEFFRSHPEYKIVHVHQDCMSSIICKVATQNGVPVRIAHSHSNSQDKNLKYPIKMFYKRSIPKYATELLACGKSAGNWMFSGAKFKIVNNAIDTYKYTFNGNVRLNARKNLGIDENAFVVGHIGRFSTVKNHTFLLDIFSQIKSRNDKAILLLIGDGELKNEIKNKVRSLELENSVIFAGVRDDVHELLQGMDIFVMPSIYEGVPLSIIEAQASSLQCIVSDTVSCECKVTDLVAFYSLSQSAAEWANYIISSFQPTRKCMYNDIKTSKYDIHENALFLQNHYIKLWDEN